MGIFREIFGLHYDNDSSLNYENDREQSLAAKVLTGAAIGVATIAALSRHGKLDDIYSKIDEFANVSSNALKKYTSEYGFTEKVLRDISSDSLISNVKNVFSEASEEYAKKEKYLIRYSKTELEDFLNDIDSLSTKLSRAISIEESNFDTFIHNDKAYDIQDILNKVKANADASKEEISSIVRDAAKDISSDDSFVNELIDHVNRYQDFVNNKFDTSKTDDFFKERVDALINLDKRKTMHFKANKDESIIHGMQYATIKDLVEAADNGIHISKNINKDSIDFLKKAIEYNDEVGNIVFSRRIFKDENGNIVDRTLLDSAYKKLIDRYSDGIIAKTLHAVDIFKVVRPSGYEVYKPGTYMPLLKGIVSLDEHDKLNSTIFVFGGKVYDRFGKKLTDQEFTLVSSQYGTRARAIKKMLGLSEVRQRYNPETLHGRILNKLDIGLQESASIFDTLYSGIKKGSYQNYLPNILKSVKNNELTYEQLVHLSEHINYSMSPIDNRTFSLIIKELQNRGSIDKFENTFYSISMQSAETIKKGFENAIAHDKEAILNNKLSMIIGSYKTDPREVLKRRIVVPDRSATFLGLAPLRIGETKKTIHGHEIIAREIQKEILLRHHDEVFDIINTLGRQGHLSLEQARHIEEMALGAYLDHNVVFKSTNIKNLTEKEKKILNDSIQHVNETLQGKYKNTLKTYVKYNKSRFKDNVFFFLENDNEEKLKLPRYIPIRKESNFSIKKSSQYVRDLNKYIKDISEGKKSSIDPLWLFRGLHKELKAGKNSPSDITNFTVASFFYSERLNELLAKVGLGLSDKSMSSPYAIAKSLVTKRILPAVIGINALKYIDFEIENLTGESASSRLYGGYTTLRLGLAKIGDITGIHDKYKALYNIAPMLQYWDENGPMNYDEYKDYLQNGYDPVRRGRFWSFGSSTSFFGEGVEYWRPTKYRLIKSNYLYTDVLYGSKKEYWKNHWLPTPRYPFAPLRHFIFDRYHWEKKHYEDRPYPVTAPLFDESTPFAPVLNSTIGSIIKPKHRMHRAEMMMIKLKNFGPIKEINEAIKTIANKKEDNKYNVASISSSGEVEPQKFVPTFAAEPGYIVESYDFNKSGDNIAISNNVSSGNYIGKPTAPNAFISGSMSKVSSNIAHINFAIKGAAKSADGGILSGVFYDYKSPAVKNLKVIENSDELTDYGYGGIRKTISDFAFSQKEVLGIFGFGAERLFGNEEEAVSGKVYENAGSMTSMSRRFYDQAIGGLGADLNEFTRRFILKQDRSILKINPLKNTMPTWLPSEFRTGDPYTKVKKGEARLPGAGYEVLNKLHPDMFGKYGAFDRFKILADIAPYSEEYKIWKSIAEQTVTDERLRKEMQNIKKRVSQQKQSHRFFEYKFKDLDTKKAKGQVLKILDNNTFIISGMEDKPLTMAGVKFTKENGGIGAVLSVGDTVTIEYGKHDSKPTGTYGKVGVVVYKNGKNINRYAIKNNIGKEKENDNTTAGIKARFSSGGIIAGKALEFVSHLNTPLHTKFLKVRSPLEEYKRTEIYGKPFQTWNHPIRSYIAPSIQAAWGHKFPLWGFTTGYITGFLTGILIGKPHKTGKLFGKIGAFGSTVNLVRYILTGKEYIPGRNKKEWKIEEYFDVVKYEKYKKLYKKASKLAKQREGVDIDKLLMQIYSDRQRRSDIVDALEAQKKTLYMQQNISDKEGAKEIKDQISAINKMVSSVKSTKMAFQPGKYSFAALFYYQQMQSTMVAITKKSSMEEIMRALPRREREYFTKFLTARKDERKKILKYVPQYEKRILKMLWKQSDKENRSIINKLFHQTDAQLIRSMLSKFKIKTYEMEYRELEKEIEKNKRKAIKGKKLPAKTWRGWKPQQNLEYVKIRTMKAYGLDIGDAGYTKYDLQAARTPYEINGFKAYPLRPFKIQRNNGPAKIIRSIRNVFTSSSIKDAEVVAIPNGDSRFEANVYVKTDHARYIFDTIGNVLN